LGIGDWAQSPIPNPQSPIPNPQSPWIFFIFFGQNKKKNQNIVIFLFLNIEKMEEKPNVN
jgi:hypothetical protein